MRRGAYKLMQIGVATVSSTMAYAVLTMNNMSAATGFTTYKFCMHIYLCISTLLLFSFHVKPVYVSGWSNNYQYIHANDNNNNNINKINAYNVYT